ncbi:MAG TPA: hypothetical protein VLL07_00330 [Pontiella sp.]|nr:hypothetical protein [Pontiella sp.]
MYSIQEYGDCLRVGFNGDFDCSTVQSIIHHETALPEYRNTNDIWVIGSHRARIRLGEIETMVREFHCRCTRDGDRTKTAIVVDEGFTHSIIELWVNALTKKVPFEIRIFNEVEDAEVWLSKSRECVV